MSFHSVFLVYHISVQNICATQNVPFMYLFPITLVRNVPRPWSDYIHSQVAKDIVILFSIGKCEWSGHAFYTPRLEIHL